MASSSTAPSGPQVDITVSLDPPTHSFTQERAPRLTLKVTSSALHPITIFTWNTPLAPCDTLTSGGYTTTDLATQERVQTSHIMVQRAPLRRTRGHPDEEYFLTLPPFETIEISTGFGRRDGLIKPQPRAVVERGWELDDEGNEIKIRRSIFPTGVDGLEPGHRYSIGLNTEALAAAWWAPVFREEVLVEGEGKGSDVQDYPWDPTPLDFHISPAVLTVLED